MESRTDFDLNQTLAAWRKRFSDELTDEQVKELETHLLETSTALQEGGLSKAEAFLVAAHRLGRPVEIGAEFSRNQLFSFTSEHARWLLTGALGYVGLQSLFGIVQRVASAGSLLLTHNTMLLGSSALIVAVVSLCVAALVLLDVARGGRRLAPLLNSRCFKSRARVALTVGLLVLGNWAASLVVTYQLNVFVNTVAMAQVGSFWKISALLNHFTVIAAAILAIAAAGFVWTPERRILTKASLAPQLTY
jgi:hypothetical protein